MQDLMGKLQDVLNSKEGQNQLQNLASILFAQKDNQANTQQANEQQANAQQTNSQPAQENNSNSNFSLNSLGELFANLSGNNSNQNAANSSNPSANLGIDMNTILNLQRVMSTLNTEDKNADLLVALKPHFSEERQKKVDQAISIMRIIKLLPLLKESGILNGILG